MTARFSRIIIALAFLGVSALAAAKADPSLQIAEAVDKRYNSLRSLKADFTEIYKGAGLQRQESGTLWLKKPGKMRWEYRDPREKLFISDGKTAYFYVPGDRQARRASMKKLDDLRSPLRYLLGKSRLRKELQDLALSREAQPLAPGNKVLRGVPRHLADRVEQVLLEITPDSLIARIVIMEVDGSTTDFRFSKVEKDPSVADERFRFRVPAGVELVEAQELQ